MKQKDPRYPYRRTPVKPAPKWRIKRTTGKSLTDFNPLYVYFTLPLRPASIGPVLGFVHTVIWKFFMAQYFRKWGLRRTPIKHVDHILDTKVPFHPEYVDVYFDFINFWIRPLVMLEKRFGTWSGSKLCAEFLNYITLAYRQAYQMYRRSMTTTVRPKCRDSALITTIQTADPHYLCVPSLHIAVVCLGFSFYRMLFKREHFSTEDSDRWGAELYARAVEIAETVLYVKQHSVNCIPAALYMMTRITPELFTIEDGVDFINSLFRNADDIAKEDKAAIREHIQFMFERLVLEGTTESDWVKPVEHWLSTYVPYQYPNTPEY